MGRMVIVPGTKGMILPGAPRIVMNEFEKEMANLPGLLHYIDPAKLNADGSGFDRFSGTKIVPRSGSNLNVIQSDPEFNNQPTLQMNNKTSALTLQAGTPTRSYTYLTVVKTEERTGYNNAFAAHDGTQYSSFFSIRENAIRLDLPNNNPSYLVQGSGEILSDGLIVLCASYDADLNQAATYYNSNGGFGAYDYTGIGNAPNVRSAYTFGGVPVSASGLNGKLGIGLIFDRAMHLPTELPFIQRAIVLLKHKYGMS